MNKIILLSLALFAILLNGCASTKTKELDFKWSNITTAKYRNDESVNSIIAVKYIGGYDAEIIMYEKDGSSKSIWTEILRCDGIVGKNGIGKTKEGDSLAPIGDFSIGKAFGLKANPGTSLEYIDIDNNLYCCGDETAYNEFVEYKNFHMIVVMGNI